MGKKVTIQDIARAVGVSPSTVSRALSNAPGVSEELRAKIRKVAKSMGYIPNMAARTLKKTRSNTVGLIIPDVTNPFFIEFIEGVDSVFFPKEYKFIVGNTDEDVERERIYLEWFISHGVDGIIAAPTAEKSDNNSRLYKRIVQMGIPLVMFDRIFENLRNSVDSVCIDNATAIYDTLIYLKNMGHEKIGLLLGKMGIYTMRIRLKSFLEGVRNLKLHTKNSWILKDLFPEKDALEKLASFLKMKDRPSAVISANQSLTRTFLKAAKNEGIDIPNDISIVSFDDALENEFYSPPITSTRQPAKEMGKISATLLLGRIEGDKFRPYKVILRTELVVRNSVKRL